MLPMKPMEADADVADYIVQVAERQPDASAFGLVLILMDYCNRYNSGLVPCMALERIEQLGRG